MYVIRPFRLKDLFNHYYQLFLCIDLHIVHRKLSFFFFLISRNLSFAESDISFFLKVLFSLWKVLWCYLWTSRKCLLHPLFPHPPPLPKKKRNSQSISHTSTSWASVYLCKIQFIDPLKCSSKGYHSLSLSHSHARVHALFTNFNIWGGGFDIGKVGESIYVCSIEV